MTLAELLPGLPLQYARRSLFLFKDTNPIRRGAVWLVESKPFEVFILAVILLNSVLLALSDYTHADSANQLLDIGWRNHAVIKSEVFFTVVFTLEAVLKIISMGFAMSKGSYLRDPWNALDFTVVLAACVLPRMVSPHAVRGCESWGVWLLRGCAACCLRCQTCPTSPSCVLCASYAHCDHSLPFLVRLAAHRLARVAEAAVLMAVCGGCCVRVPDAGMRLLVTALLNSLPALLNVVFLMMFLFTVFGILGVQLL